ncbi:MAG: hypothetical protein KME17_10510 [Cyanosarcina radialis HA8281-LM2]|jgi:predicted HAD superfamily hydrolase|nr:hypothetical protein [Cyanosarcina radialis HA8281-LM2]
MQSFDIFDTLLVRIWARPTDLFWELGDRLQQALLIEVSPETWQKIRIEAESAARPKTLNGEVTLDQIYAELQQIFGWSSAEVEKAIALEIALERFSLRPIPETQRRIRESRQQQQAIAYLSDMYLPTEIIKSFLQEGQIWADGDLIHVSAEVGVGKGSGKLFEHHLLQSGLKHSQLHHTGDNLHADVNVPQKMGIQVSHFLQAHLNRYESSIADNENLPLRFRSLLAGASRLTRLQCPETDPRKQTIWNTAANVIAPLLFGFVHWVLTQAKEQGIQRLYFMARDGQILLKVAQEICRQWNYDIECRYLYGSRQSFHFPSIQQLGETEFNWLFDNPAFLSVRIVCQRIHLEPEEIADTLASYGFSVESWDKNLTESEAMALKQVFQEPAVTESILARAATYREQAIGYFKQEGMGDGTPFATVDIGWSGKSQRSLSQLLAAGDIYPTAGLKGFFFGLLSTTQAFPSDRLMPYFLAANELTERRFLCDPQILELFMAGDHGSTVRYERQGDRYIPILRSEKNESGIAWGVLVQHQAIVEFAKCLTENLRSQECQADIFRQITEDLLKTFIRSPSKAEAEAFGTQSFSQHQSESKFYDLAPAYNSIDGLKMLFDSNLVHGFAWLTASMQRSAPLARLPLGYIKGRRDSFSCSFFAWEQFQQGNEKLARDLARKALNSSLTILLSKRFISMSIVLLIRYLFPPKQSLQTASIDRPDDNIVAQPSLETDFNRYEKAIADNERLPLQFRSLLAGASRLTRLECLETETHRLTIWDTAANVVGPVCFGFVYWVLIEARERGIKRLYFMARDGQILGKVAQIICQKWGYDIECRYFYGSRQSLHFPSIQEIGEAELEWIFDRPQFCSVRTICDRVNLQPEQITDLLAHYDFPSQTWDKNLTETEFETLKAVFQEPTAADLIADVAATYREKAIGYFQQEGMSDGVPFAIVDTGWSGRSQRSLSKLLASANMYPETGLWGFYFGLEKCVKAVPSDRLMPYFMAHDAITERRLLCDSQIIELFLAADHGTTVRYEKEGDRYIPILRSEKNEKGIQWGVLVQQQAILKFVERLTKNLPAEDCRVQDFHQVTEDLLGMFIRTPSKAEAEAFGTQSFAKDQTESKFYDLAPAYDLKDSLRMLFDRRYVHGFAWLSASIQRSAPLTKLPLHYIKGWRSSFSYADLTHQAYLAGKDRQSWEFAKKAVKACPVILLSRQFIRTNFSLAVRSLLGSPNPN